MDKEERNYCCLLLLLTRVGCPKIRQCFIRKWDVASKCGTWQDLGSNGNDLLNKFHFKPFSKDVDKVKFGDTKRWDLSLLVKALLDSKPPFVAKKTLVKSLECLKKTRDTVSHSNGKITTADFNKQWSAACNSLMVLGATKEEFKKVKQDMRLPWKELTSLMKQCANQDDENGLQKIQERLERLELGQQEIKQLLHKPGSSVPRKLSREDHEQHSDSSGQSGSSSVTVDHSAGNGSQHKSSSGYMSNNYQDPTQRNQPEEISYQSLSHTTPVTNSGGQTRSTAPSSSQSGSAGLPPSQSGSAGLPPSQSGSTATPTDESGLPGPPSSQSGSTAPSSSQSGPAECNNLIKDILCKSESVVDILTSMLDTDYKLLQNHRHLADYLNAPPDIKQKCNCPTIHSCTLVMLRLPHIQDVTVNTLREKVDRKDVLNLIDQRIPSKSRCKTIKEALNDEVMDEIAIKLDQPSSRIRQNWKDVGKQLEIDSDDLDQIERGESNPAKELLEYAYISVNPTLTTSGKFREIIMGFENRKDLHNLIEEVGITQDSDLNRPLKEVIRPDSSNMKKMAAHLNRSPPGLSNWKQLASAWGLSSDQFKPQPPQSPTKSLLDWMCTEDHVITVDQFLDILGVKMKRYDVKEALKKEIQKVPRR